MICYQCPQCLNYSDLIFFFYLYYFILFYLILSYLILSYLILSYSVLFYVIYVMPYHVIKRITFHMISYSRTSRFIILQYYILIRFIILLHHGISSQDNYPDLLYEAQVVPASWFFSMCYAITSRVMDSSSR